MAPRLAPPDRRAPVQVFQARCPMGASCGCCPSSANNNHARSGKPPCPHPHPPTDRMCRLPCPSDIPPCAERATQPQFHGALPIACCIECGRVTARRWTDPENRILAWCAGALPDSSSPGAVGGRA